MVKERKNKVYKIEVSLEGNPTKLIHEVIELLFVEAHRLFVHHCKTLREARKKANDGKVFVVKMYSCPEKDYRGDNLDNIKWKELKEYVKIIK